MSLDMGEEQPSSISTVMVSTIFSWPIQTTVIAPMILVFRKCI